MATGRMLKRNISESRRLSELKSDSARLLWTWIIPYLDADGRFFASASMIKGKVVPRLPTFNERNITKYLYDMADVGLITLYEVDGEKLLQYRKFGDFQKIVKDREAHSLPSPEEGKILTTPSRANPDKVGTRSKQHESNLIESNLIESKLTEVETQKPVDNSPKEKTSLLEPFINHITRIKEKFNSPKIEAQVVLFLSSHANGANRDAIIYCLDEFLKYGEGTQAHKVKIYLEKILLRVNGNYNEAEHTAKAQEFKKPLPTGFTKLGDIKAMPKGGPS